MSIFGDKTLLICVEGTETPAGLAGQGETPQALSAEEAHRPPAESEVPGAQINRLFITTKK
jgi:hypothetical protein